ncbi:MAG: hypothetical protein WCA46_28190 [Actinocatenispora sp.]
MTDRAVTVSVPLFTTTALLPLSEPGGVAYPMRHRPGNLRPYAATLGVPMPAVGKHHTTSTAPPTSMPTQVSNDGKVTPDSNPDTGSDS